ncbi:MAG: Fe-S cluster assembly protein SufD [Nitrospirae bacterium]|nr:Fe-S cluster assembly protein SufD [Nitrospirota bacterium]
MGPKELYLSHFERMGRTRGVDGSPWIEALRTAAMARFAEIGFPTPQDEDWKYTNVSPIAKTAFNPATRDPADSVRLRLFKEAMVEPGPHVLVFVNGAHAPEISTIRRLPGGARVQSLLEAADESKSIVESHLGRHALFRDRAFTALNTAFIHDGAFVHIPKGIEVRDPIHLLFIATTRAFHGESSRGPRSEAEGATHGEPWVSHPRNLIVVEEGASAAVVETYVGHEEGVYFTNAVTEVAAGPGARVEHYKVQRESGSAFHVAAVQARQARDSRFTSFSLSLGGALTRNDYGVVLAEEGSECDMDGLYMADGRRHVDTHTLIDHARPGCRSSEVYRGVLDGSARGVFNGRIVVRPDAIKTDATQSNKNLLLSEEASVKTKPQLEIFADDVKCAHGATVGQLDEDAMFYLRSRGLDREAASTVLTYAFANEVLSRIRREALRGYLEKLVASRLPAAAALGFYEESSRRPRSGAEGRLLWGKS